MPHPTREQYADRFAVGLCLDHLWSETMGLPIDDKEAVLEALARVLRTAQTSYALIGGVAVQLYTTEPRTTADVDVALVSRDDIPRAELELAGFTPDGEHSWSENWRGPAPSGTPRKLRVSVQFSAGGRMAGAAMRAEVVSVGKFELRLATLSDLLLLKLDAASEETRRTRKRMRDVTDVAQLLDEHAELDGRAVREELERIWIGLLRARPERSTP